MTLMKENISQMLDSIASKDFDAASEMFNTIVADKVGAALENLKVDVANRHFNGVKESVETLDEISREKAIAASAERDNRTFELDDYNDGSPEMKRDLDRSSKQGEKNANYIAKRWGNKGTADANKAANKKIFGK